MIANDGKISRKEYEEISATLAAAHRGSACLPELSRAYAICQRVGAKETMALLTSCCDKQQSLMPNIVAGLISGAIVWAVLGRSAA